MGLERWERDRSVLDRGRGSVGDPGFHEPYLSELAAGRVFEDDAVEELPSFYDA